MAFREDDRGQAIQIGAVLLFAVLVIAFSLHQAFVVPNQNKTVEINHNAEVQSQLQELRNAVHSVVGGTPGSGVSIGLGTAYPSRLVALNPPPPSGQLRTVGTTSAQVNVTIINATADGETGDVWNGSARRYNTGGLLYVPNYNEYNAPPRTIYENSLLYNSFGEESLALTDQSLISGDRLSIVTLNGSFDRAGTHSTTVDPEGISTSERTIAIEGDGGPITLNITTRLSPDRWRTLLSDEPNVVTADIRSAPDTGAVPAPFRRVVIPLRSGEDYTLRMTKVGVGTGTTEEEAEYLTDIDGDGSQIVQGQRQRVVLEVRDAYNNPETGVRVNGTVAGSGFLERTKDISDDDGRVAFTYVTTDATATGTNELQFSLADPTSNFDRETGPDVSVNVTVSKRNEGGDQAFDVAWEQPPFQAGVTSESLSSADTPRGVPFTALVTDDNRTVALATVDYAISNASIVTVVPTEGETNATGYNSTDVVRQQDGRTRVYATSSGVTDSLNYTFDRVLYDEFEQGTLPANGWIYRGNGHGGDGGVRDIGSGADSGNQVAYINGDGGTISGDRSLRMTYPIDTTEQDTLSITYVVREDNTGSYDDPEVPGAGNAAPSENLKLQYRSSGGGWVTVDTVSSKTDDPADLPRSYYRRVQIQNIDNASHQNFEVRFVQGETTAVDEWQIDTLDIVGISRNPITDLNGDPFANFTLSPQNPSAGETVAFDAARSDDPDDSITSYDWDFGDGGTGSGRTVNHVYDSPGDYTVTLSVTDEFGSIATKSRDITITEGDGGGQTVAFPDAFNDGVAPNPATDENESIPPSAPVGELRAFTRLQQQDGLEAPFYETGNELSIGVVTRNISAGDHTLSMNYSKANNGEDFTVVVVDEAGNELDSATDYTLSAKSGSATFPLSTAESDYIDQTGNAYFVINDNNPNKGNTLYFDDITIKVN